MSISTPCEFGFKQVIHSIVNENKELVHITINGVRISTTKEHPFYIIGHGWKLAEDIMISDKIKSKNGLEAVVEKVEVEILDTCEKTYNLIVENYHTYFVSKLMLLVHNTCQDLARGRARQAQAKMTNSESILGGRRIPDYLNHNRKLLGEAKSVKKLSYSSQLRDFSAYAKNSGYKMFLKVEKWTEISNPLKQAIANGDIILCFF